MFQNIFYTNPKPTSDTNIETPLSQEAQSSLVEQQKDSAMSSSTEKEPSTEQAQQQASEQPAPETPEKLTGDEKPEEIAKRLSAIIDSANTRIEPLIQTMNDHFAKAEADEKNDNLDEKVLVDQVRPLIEQSTAILKETHGAIQALDPEGTIANNATRKAADHEATKEEQHLAESLGKLTGDVTKAIENARDKIKNMPQAKKDLGPLLDMLSDPLFQIVGGVGMLLNGVLRLLGNIVSVQPYSS